MIIYWDIIFIINMIMNFIILYITGKLTKNNPSIIKLIFGSTIGNIYMLVLIFPSLEFLLSISMKIFLSLMMIIVTFFPNKIKDFVKVLGYFYIVSFMIGGGAFGLFYFIDINSVFSNELFVFNQILVPWWILFISVIFVYILIKVSWVIVHKKLLKEKELVPLTIFYEDKFLVVKALIDTGNDLKDPFSKNPVIVVEYKAVKNILSKELQNIINYGLKGNLQEAINNLTKYSFSSRFRVIPFTSIGCSEGLMIGFRPDKIKVETIENKIVVKQAIIGVYDSELSKDGEYNALLHPELLNC